MSKAPYIALVIVLLLLVGGAAFLAAWHIPPPSKSVEKVLPDERFPADRPSPGPSLRRSMFGVVLVALIGPSAHAQVDRR